MLELQYDLESKAAKSYATIDITNAFFSIPLEAKCRTQFSFTWKGVQCTWNQLFQRWKPIRGELHSLTCTSPDCTEWSSKTPAIYWWYHCLVKYNRSFWEREENSPNSSETGFAIKQSKVKELAQEIQFLGLKCQDGHHHVPTEVANNPFGQDQTLKICSTLKLGNVLTWKIWQRTSEESQSQPLGFWSQGDQGSEAHYTHTKKRDFNRLWGGLICLRSCWDRSMSPLGTVIAQVTLGVQRKHPLHTSHDQCNTESGGTTDNPMSPNGKIQFTKNSGRVMDWPKGWSFVALPEKVTQMR